MISSMLKHSNYFLKITYLFTEKNNNLVLDLNLKVIFFYFPLYLTKTALILHMTMKGTKSSRILNIQLQLYAAVAENDTMSAVRENQNIKVAKK